MLSNNGLKKIQSEKRKQIIDCFNKTSLEFENKFENKEEKVKITYQDLFAGELIKIKKKKIHNFIFQIYQNNEVFEKLEIIKAFDNFSSYFKGFFDNRKNIFSADDKTTSIAHRIVDINFSKFLQNCEVVKKLRKFCPQCIEKAEKILANEGLNDSVEHVFSLDNYNCCLTQEQIDLYNKYIGGIPATVGKEKVKGLNEIINNECQKNNDLNEILKKNHASTLTELYKQILSDRKDKFILDEFSSGTDAIEAVKHFYEDQMGNNGAVPLLLNLFKNFDKYDLKYIYVNKSNLNFLSTYLFGGANWNFLSDAITKFNKKLASIKDISVDDLNSAYVNVDEDKSESITSLFYKSFEKKIGALLAENCINWPEALKNANDKHFIKDKLDSLLDIFKLSKVFITDVFNKDFSFYVDYERALQKLEEILSLYNKVRNFATKKTYNIDKIKLNFECYQLCSGFSESKENDYLGVFFIRGDKLFLGILKKGLEDEDKKLFSEEKSKNEENAFQKVRYHLLDIHKNLTRCSLALTEVKKHFNSSSEDLVLSNSFSPSLKITKDLYDIYTEGKFKADYAKKDAADYRCCLTKWIEFAISFLKSYQSTKNVFDYKDLKKAEEYVDVKSFYEHVDSLNYKIDFIPFSSEYIEQLINDNKLYLFQIYNKDFSLKSTGSKNLHTLYLKNIFSSENLKSVVIKLNGKAELFYRAKSIETSNACVHKADSILVNKDYLVDSVYKHIPDQIYEEIYKYKNHKIDVLSDDAQKFFNENERLITTKTATHEIIKDKRFTQDKFFFHLSITLNFKEKDNVSSFNKEVLTFLKNNNDINIIGIDRGERNLIYATVIDQKGNVLETKSFNLIKQTKIDNNIVQIDYNSKLKIRENARLEERRSWDSISKIKDLKEGYLSSVIHQLSCMMIKYNAIIVLENLNSGFKRIRSGISEKSVYQKFEKMLIDKLNYLVFKNVDVFDKGGVLNAYQLTDKFSSFSKLGAQCGFLFYIPSAYTSKIDPETGFADVFNFSCLKNNKSIKEFFDNFQSISYDKSEDLFKFSVDFSNKKISLRAEMFKKKWDIFSYGKRIIRRKINNFKTEIVDPTENLKSLFSNNNIDFENGNNL